VIPGGAHTYSRGYDQFPKNAPQILKSGKGAYVYDDLNNEYLDYGMSLRAVHLGYAHKDINDAAIKQIEYGNNLTRASMIELEAAELLVNMIDSVDMVKFTKNGSTATTAAIKLARAYTNKELILRCSEHPFFSYDDWFIGSTAITRGIPKETQSKTKLFHYNDIKSIELLIEKYPNEIACLIMEPSSTEHPKENFLQKIQKICNDNGIVFILDEMITGFRWDLKGAQHYYGVTPDLTTFGKAMANGFSVAAIGGCRKIMSLASIENIGEERLFFLSTTHGAEMNGLGAFVETMKFMRNNKVIEHFWAYGKRMKIAFNNIAKEYKIDEYISMDGIDCSPYYITKDSNKDVSLAYRTLFSQEMIKNGVLMPWIALSYAHQELEFEKTVKSFEKSLYIYKKALNEGIGLFLEGDAIKPVFRKYN